MKKLSRTGPSIGPWGTPLVTDLQLHFVPLITTLWAWSFSQFSTHLTVCLSSPYQLLYEDLLGDSVKGPAEVQVDNIHCSPLVYQASHFIVEVYQVGQARIPFGEAMLTTPDKFLLLNAPGYGFQD